MAKRRMFSLDVVDTDSFLDLPASSQSLYFHLGMRADDDGFVSSPKRITAMVGAAGDDLKLLIAKGFVIPFESGVCVIRDWRVNNYIQRDRYTPSIYTEEKQRLSIAENGRYSHVDTQCIQDVSKSDTQVRIDKEREEIDNKAATPPRARFIPPTLEEVQAYCIERENSVDAAYFLDYYAANGWVQGKGKPIKDWKACVRTWERQGYGGEQSSAVPKPRQYDEANRIIKNPLYIGILCNGESRSENVLTELQIIDVDLFERAQKMIESRAKPRTAHKEIPLNTRGQSLLVGNVYCGHCGKRLTLATSGRKYQKKDGTVVNKTYARYQCSYNIQHPGGCDGPSGYGAAKLDDLVDQIIRIQFERIKTAPPQALIREQQSREVEIAKAKLNLLNGQYQQKQRDYQDLRAETLRVIRGDSRLNVDFLNSIVDETITQLKELGQQVKEAEAELRELVSGAEQVKEEYAQLMNWAELYDKCTFEAKKMIAAQFVKAVHVKRDYEIDVEFNVAFDEFQSIYLEPEKEDEKKRGASTLLALGENVGQAV